MTSSIIGQGVSEKRLKVEYALTKKGKQALPVIDRLNQLQRNQRTLWKHWKPVHRSCCVSLRPGLS
jgi:DNA-binding HxlR family transcriptional regulator